MNRDERIRVAAGETDELPPAPPAAGISDGDSVRKDTSYSPASETETQHKQSDPLPDTVDGDIDPDDVRVVPGTGGPDDAGDVDVDPADLNMPNSATH